MSLGNAHKPIEINMSSITDVNTLYKLFGFVKLFVVIGKGFMLPWNNICQQDNCVVSLEIKIAIFHQNCHLWLICINHTAFTTQ